ncbi:MAG TPA: zinc ABC transporter substrate-binding protein [Candidatus Saccharimonadales bacterium]|jgi:zinc/manganese transport system substrate-binding protein|nr:zinc ABC transporter substrate-binding protein [Candidatus Saccharimonadales bacterium]
MSRKVSAAIIVIVLLVIGAVGLLLGKPSTSSSNGQLQIVAGENFWGSLVSQLGGSHVHVTSIVSDPNADPHEYESNTTTARQFATANYVILNGAGYDSWGDKLLSAGSEPNRKVLKVATLLSKKEGDNPHFWYNPVYVNQVVKQMESDLATIDPGNKTYYEHQLTNLETSLAGYQGQISSIKQQFAGTRVAATEDIFAYLAQASGLNLISPPTFIQAVAEGNDPPANSVVTFQQQLESRQPKVLVYNTQTVTPLTESIKKLAASNNIPIVGISETIQPPNARFQDWMSQELTNLETALKSASNSQ